MDLSIIIINWNSKGYLRECLLSLARSPGNVTTEILVIDNASHDGVAQMLAAEFPCVTFMQSERNLGFSGGNNRAAHQATGDFLLFLNPDTLVEGDALIRLVETLRHRPDAGMVGARLLNTDRTLQTSCILSFPTLFNQLLDCEFLRRRFPRSGLWGMAPLFGDSPEPAPVEAISGACMMIRRELFTRLEGFDERYFMYAEDVDLSYKVHEAGFKCYYMSKASVIHHGGGSSEKARSTFSSVMMRESVYRFLKHKRGWSSAVLYRIGLALSSVFRIASTVAAQLFKGQWPSFKNPVTNKWSAILRWSIGTEMWSRAAEPAQNSVKA
jgi:GT2 family glycosyltransferase